MVTSNNPSRGRMSPRSTIWGQAKGSLMGDPLPPKFTKYQPCTIMPVPPRGATSANKVGALMLCDGKSTMGMQKREGNASENPDAMSSPGYVPLKLHDASSLIDTADGKLSGYDPIIRYMHLNFSTIPFNIDLCPVEQGSFDGHYRMDFKKMTLRDHVAMRNLF
ncbi:hypothetical protein Tco_0893958 [Tanacetum coccineum]|uniref:Uncharacterized protein n=1 Tax=Tanacetum coccineum TaxID=301880 RepID=A0ABQ5CAB8_9ASTR